MTLLFAVFLMYMIMAVTMIITAAIETETPIMIFFSVSSGVLSEIGLTGSNCEAMAIKGNPFVPFERPLVNYPEE